MPKRSSQPRSADFLVIGAMKCGTTTLYRDLLAQRSIFLPDKESNFLLRENEAQDYFDKAKPEQICGEVCPDYAKLLESDGVAKKAAQFSPKIIYLVRNPIDRMISHHHFISSFNAPQNRGMPRNIDAAVVIFQELIDYGRYAFQLKPWIEALGRESILVMRFEDYVTNRIESLERICEFIGAEFLSESIDAQTAHNRSSQRPVLTPFWKKIRENSFYRAALRPFTSLEMRNRIRKKILPSASARPEPPSTETLNDVTEIFRADLEELRLLLDHEQPLWDL